jgi:uncharacterized membrane protein YqgA involved in biofilm formation
MNGTLLNVAAIVVGAGAGTLLGARVPERVRTSLTDVLGVFVLVLGVGDALGTFGDELSGALGRSAVLVVLGSLLVGGVIGELIDIEARLERLGAWLRARTVRRPASIDRADGADGAHGADDDGARARFIEGFVVTSLIVTVGPLAILGALQDGLLGDWTLLAVKSLLDGPVALAFASVFGIGVAFAALPLLVWQGGLTLAAAAVGGLVSDHSAEPVKPPLVGQRWGLAKAAEAPDRASIQIDPVDLGIPGTTAASVSWTQTIYLPEQLPET